MASIRIVLAVAATMTLASPSANATPQLGAELTTGAGLIDLRTRSHPKVAYHLGARFDLLLLRDRAETMALGPYLDVATTGFDAFESGGGVEWLVPAGDTAFILSAGAFARLSHSDSGGVSSTVFWGSRSYNYDSVYSLGVGLFLQGRYGFGDDRQCDAIAGVQIDLEYLALPFLFAYEAIAH